MTSKVGIHEPVRKHQEDNLPEKVDVRRGLKDSVGPRLTSPCNCTRAIQFPLGFQANPYREGPVYSKNRLTSSGRFPL